MPTWVIQALFKMAKLFPQMSNKTSLSLWVKWKITMLKLRQRALIKMYVNALCFCAYAVQIMFRLVWVCLNLPHELSNLTACEFVCVCRCCDLPVTEHACSCGTSTGLLLSNICIDLFQHVSACSLVCVLLTPSQHTNLTLRHIHACWLLHVY